MADIPNYLKEEGPIPKPKRSKKKRLKADEPESVIQTFVDSLIKWLRLESIRFPDKITRLMTPHIKNVHRCVSCGRQQMVPKLNDWERGLLSSIIKGRSDNIVMYSVSDKYFLGMNLELKTNLGKLTRGRDSQTERASALPFVVPQSRDEAEAALKKFKSDAEKVKARWFKTMNEEDV